MFLTRNQGQIVQKRRPKTGAERHVEAVKEWWEKNTLIYFRDFFVTSKPKYFPSIRRVWASIAGKAPNKTEVTGTSAHWKTMMIQVVQ